MRLDIRFPIGLLFTVIALVLLAYGLLSDSAIYKRSLGINVSLWWGLVLLAFGIFMLFMARRAAQKREPETTKE